MRWLNVNFDWNRARAFLITAEEGSLSAAARALGMAQSTVGRQVEALEAELGVLLFERTGRGLVLTPTGTDLLDYVRAMSEAAGQLSLAASGRTMEISGQIRITASEFDSAFLLAPLISRLRNNYPGIEIEIVASNEPIDLRRREADIALRNFLPSELDLVTRKVGESVGRLYASDDYLRSIGRPKTPDDLLKADFIGFDESDVLIKALRAMGLNVDRDHFKVLTSNHLVQWQLMKTGAGVGIFFEATADHEPGVSRVLPDLPPLKLPIWLTVHREVSTSRRVRLVFDFLAEELGRNSKNPNAFPTVS